MNLWHLGCLGIWHSRLSPSATMPGKDDHARKTGYFGRRRSEVAARTHEQTKEAFHAHLQSPSRAAISSPRVNQARLNTSTRDHMSPGPTPSSTLHSPTHHPSANPHREHPHLSTSHLSFTKQTQLILSRHRIRFTFAKGTLPSFSAMQTPSPGLDRTLFLCFVRLVVMARGKLGFVWWKRLGSGLVFGSCCVVLCVGESLCWVVCSLGAD